MWRSQRRTTPRVRNGRVQRKNRWDRSPNIFHDEMPALVIDRRRAGRGYRHLVRKEDVRRFIRLLPDWDRVSEGLRAIVLDSGRDDCIGWHRPGVVALCAWDATIEWNDCSESFCREHAPILEKLAIPVERGWDGELVVRFTVGTARAFLLIHVLLHELGHHRDRMTTRSQRRACRGEGYAESYARRFEDEILWRYRAEFGI